MILVLYRVQRFAVGAIVSGFEFRRCHTGYLPELFAEMLGAAVTSLPGNFAQRLFSIYQQFFDPVDPLRDEVFFNGYTFHH